MLASLDVGFSHQGTIIWESGDIVDVARFEFPKGNKKKIRASSDRIDRAARWTKQMYDFLWDYGVDGVIGELPHGGSRNVNAASEMNCATVLCGSLCTLMELPCEWCTPNDVKMGMCNKKSASKQEVIDAVVKWMKGTIKVQKKKTSTLYHITTTNNGVITFPKTKMDDIADAIAVYKVMATSNMVRMYG